MLVYFYSVLFVCYYYFIIVLSFWFVQATVTLKESDYFKVRVPNAIVPVKQTVLAPVQVGLKF